MANSSLPSVNAVEKFDGIIIIGGGLVGALAAITLAKRDYKVRLYEQRPDWRVSDAVAMDADDEDKSKSAIKRSMLPN